MTKTKFRKSRPSKTGCSKSAKQNGILLICVPRSIGCPIYPAGASSNRSRRKTPTKNSDFRLMSGFGPAEKAAVLEGDYVILTRLRGRQLRDEAALVEIRRQMQEHTENLRSIRPAELGDQRGRRAPNRSANSGHQGQARVLRVRSKRKKCHR